MLYSAAADYVALCCCVSTTRRRRERACIIYLMLNTNITAYSAASSTERVVQMNVSKQARGPQHIIKIEFVYARFLCRLITFTRISLHMSIERASKDITYTHTQAYIHMNSIPTYMRTHPYHLCFNITYTYKDKINVIHRNIYFIANLFCIYVYG